MISVWWPPFPMKELMDGMGWTPVPIPEGALSNWKNLPKHSDSAPPAEGAIDPEGDGSDTEGDNEEPEERTEEFETAPLASVCLRKRNECAA